MDNNGYLNGKYSKTAIFKMLVSGCAVGIFAGLVTSAYRLVLTESEILRTEVFSSADSILKVTGIFAALMILGLIVGRISKDEPLIKGSGIPQVQGQIEGFFSPVWWKILIKKFITGALGILSGLSMGMGGLLGAIAGEAGVFIFGLPEEYVMNFILLGMTGLFAGIFRTPVTAVVLVAEMSGSLTQFIGLSMVACISLLMANLLGSRPICEQMFDNITPEPLINIKKHTLDIMNITVPLDNMMEGRRIRELNLPEGCSIIEINRHGIILTPNEMTEINRGDILSVVYKNGRGQEVLDSMGIYS